MPSASGASPNPTPESEAPHGPSPASYAFGDGMVLQRAPAKAAVYGFAPFAATAVTVTVSGDSGAPYTVDATVTPTATAQPFGEGFGVRPCPKAACPPYDMVGWNPWNKPINSWKALLRPTAATSSGAPQGFNITARCTRGCAGPANVTEHTITGVVFGDMWFCSGQSNMWLPVDHSFSRNATADAIKAGKYTNVRGMFGGSANKPRGSSWTPGGGGYGRHDGTSPWLTAAEAVATGASAANGGSYPLFKMGASCWYFGQRLSELGVDVPLGLVDTAIGGQRIEEYMENVTIHACTNRSSENIPWWDGELYAQMVLPFVDMTVKGWVWYQASDALGGARRRAADPRGPSAGREQHGLAQGLGARRTRVLVRAESADRGVAQGVERYAGHH